MKLENRFVVPVGVDQAWRVLLDLERIAPCIPGATLNEVTGEEFTGRVKVKVGPIMLTYQGTGKFVRKNAQTHEAVVEAHGKETRGTGTANATVTTSLRAAGDSTEVFVVTDLVVTGKPAQFGRGVMADVAGKLTDQFASCLAEEVRGRHQHGPDGTAPAAAPAAAASITATSRGGPATADSPLPPTGAPQEPATAVPLPTLSPEATMPAAATAPATAAAGGVQHRPHRPAEAIDLLETATGPVLKRLLPLTAAAALVVLLVRLLRRR